MGVLIDEGVLIGQRQVSIRVMFGLGGLVSSVSVIIGIVKSNSFG